MPSSRIQTQLFICSSSESLPDICATHNFLVHPSRHLNPGHNAGVSETSENRRGLAQVKHASNMSPNFVVSHLVGDALVFLSWCIVSFLKTAW